jgi:DNA (cytosine-5)-methyltransferase 1
MKLKHLDLFSGIGGFSLGLEATGHFDTIAFCDYEPYCQKVLRKHWPWVTIYDDVKELNSERLSSNGHTKIDIITGGYPCQPFSIAGRQKGEQDPRHVWPEMFRLVKELRPTWVIGENVSGHIKLGLDTVLENLESEGYSARAFSISASSVGAVHQRERVWIVGYSEHNGSSTTEKSRVSEKTDDNSKEGQNKTIQFERTGGSHNSEDVENTRCSQWPWSFFGNQDEDETREGDAYQFERSGSTSKIDVADTEGKRAREDNQGLWSRTERIDRRQTTNVADTEGVSSYGREDREHTEQRDAERQVGGESGNDAHTDIEGLEGRWSQCELRESQEEGQIGWSQWWQSEPNVGRVAHGVPKRVDRLKSLGNSLVPMIPYYIGMSIKKGDML